MHSIWSGLQQHCLCQEAHLEDVALMGSCHTDTLTLTRPLSACCYSAWSCAGKLGSAWQDSSNVAALLMLAVNNFHVQQALLPSAKACKVMILLLRLHLALAHQAMFLYII